MEGQQEGNDFTLYGIVTGLQEPSFIPTRMVCASQAQTSSMQHIMESSLLMSLYTFDEFRRIAAHNGIRSNILRHHSRCGNDGILTNGYSGQDSCTSTDPSITADVYWCLQTSN